MNPSQNPSALRSKEIITNTLLKLMKQYSYSDITVKHILLEADVSRKTFYRNFDTKDDVLQSYLEMILYEYFESLTIHGEYHMPQMLNIIFPFLEKYKDFLFLLRDNNLLYLLLLKLNLLVPIEHAQITNNTPNEISRKSILLSKYIMFFNIGGVWNLIIYWIENDMQDDITEIKQIVMDYLTNTRNIDLRNL